MNNCIETVTHSRIKVEELKRKATFRNPTNKPYKKGRIDGCLVKEGIRADYFVDGEGKSVLVELKGCDIDHACAQLFAAVEHANVKPHLSEKIGFMIICSRYPSHNTSVQLSAAKARRRYGAKLLVFTREREVDMSMF